MADFEFWVAVPAVDGVEFEFLGDFGVHMGYWAANGLALDTLRLLSAVDCGDGGHIGIKESVACVGLCGYLALTGTRFESGSYLRPFLGTAYIHRYSESTERDCLPIDLQGLQGLQGRLAQRSGFTCNVRFKSL